MQTKQINRKIKQPLSRTACRKNAEIYKILSNPKRLEILDLLSQQEMSVEELVNILRISKTNVSQHLALLRHADLVKFRREGLNAYYTIVNPEIMEPCHIFNKIL